jgi:hypothetical protein
MIKAEIVAHSLSPQGDELISVLCTFPRIILAEVNTHRMLSKNTSSSRAIPFKKMVQAVIDNPFIPIAWQKEHTGMQGTEYFLKREDIDWNISKWLTARDNTINSAKYLNAGFPDDKESIGVTKQLCNRLLEPFMWTTMLITGSKEGWDNFFNLRCPQYQDIYTKNKYYKSWKTYLQHIEDYQTLDYAKNLDVIGKLRENKGQAEIHIMDLAEKIYDAMNESTPEQLKVRGWHIPFAAEITDLYIKNKGYIPETEIPIDEFVKISTAMAAHTSYTIVGGEAVKSYEKWIDLHDKLIAYDPPHSSPMEHCARAMSDEEFVSFTKTIHSTSNKVEKTNQGGLRQGEVLVNDFIVNREEHYGWCNNLKGFIPYRYMIDNKINLNGK